MENTKTWIDSNTVLIEKEVLTKTEVNLPSLKFELAELEEKIKTHPWTLRIEELKKLIPELEGDMSRPTE